MPLRAGSSPKAAPQMGSRPPYGLSFAVEDLAEAKEWSERSELSLSVILDHVIENAEFEEVLIIASADRQQRILTIWKTRGSIHAQRPQGTPRAYATMAQALEAARSKSIRRQPWRLFPA